MYREIIELVLNIYIVRQLIEVQWCIYELM